MASVAASAVALDPMLALVLAEVLESTLALVLAVALELVLAFQMEYPRERKSLGLLL